MINRPVAARKATAVAAHRKARGASGRPEAPVAPNSDAAADTILRTFCWLARQPGGGLTVRQVATVLELARIGEEDFGLTADRLGVSRPTLSRIVERLIDTGLVIRRVRPEDRRRLLLSVTPEGAEFAGSILQGGPDGERMAALPPAVAAAGPADDVQGEGLLATSPLVLSGTVSFSVPPARGRRRSTD